MSRSRRTNSGVRPFYSFILSWLFLSAFMKMFRPLTFLFSLGLCGLISYFTGRAGSKRAQQKAEEALRKLLKTITVPLEAL